MGPCDETGLEKDYVTNIDFVVDIFKGKVAKLKQKIKSKMELMAKEERFEEAAFYRDQFETLKNNPVFDTSVISMNNTIFNNRRFSGKDRVGDQQFYSIGIEYKKRHMNMEKLSLSLSQQFYLKDRKVFLNDMMMQMNMNMGIGLSLIHI